MVSELASRQYQIPPKNQIMYFLLPFARISPNKYVMIFLSLLLTTGCTNETVEPKVKLDFAYDPFTITSLEEAGVYTGAIETPIEKLSYFENIALEKLNDAISFKQLEQYGKNYRQRISGEYELLFNHAQQSLLEEILRRLVEVFDVTNIPHPDWQVHIVRNREYAEINAFTDGYNITFTEEMLKLCEGDSSRLAGILAHEMFHAHNHDLHHQHYRYELFDEYLGSRWGGIVAKFYDKYIASALSQSKESLADVQGIALVDAAGFDAYESIKVDYLLMQQHPGERGFASLLSSHPPSTARLQALSMVLETARIRAEQEE